MKKFIPIIIDVRVNRPAEPLIASLTVTLKESQVYIHTNADTLHAHNAVQRIGLLARRSNS